MTLAPISCFGSYECHGHQKAKILVNAEDGCLSFEEAKRAFPERRVSSGVVKSQLARVAMAVCWYRPPETARASCSGGTTRAALREQSAPRPQLEGTLYPTSSTGFLYVCDAKGALYGYAIHAEPGPSGAVVSAVAECPETLGVDLLPPAYADEPPVSFVGRDFYPALLRCTYESSAAEYCGSGGGGDTIGMLGG